MAMGRSLARVRNRSVESGFLIWKVIESGILPSGVPWGATLGAIGPSGCFLTVGIMPCRFDSAQRSNMLAKNDTASSNAAKQCGKGERIAVSSGHPYPGKPTKFLNEREFHDYFCLPNGIFVQLVEADPMATEKA